MAYQITGNLTVCLRVCSGGHQRNIKFLHYWHKGNPLVTSGFPSQRASNVEIISSCTNLILYHQIYCRSFTIDIPSAIYNLMNIHLRNSSSAMKHYPGAHFTHDFSRNPNQHKNYIAVIRLLVIRLLQIFVHARAVHLSCHVQNFAVITWSQFGWEQKEISKEYEMRWKICQQNGSQVTSIKASIFHCVTFVNIESNKANQEWLPKQCDSSHIHCWNLSQELSFG